MSEAITAPPTTGLRHLAPSGATIGLHPSGAHPDITQLEPIHPAS